MTDPDQDFREPHLRHGDFLGAFGIIERDGRILMVQNNRIIDGRPTKTWDLPGGQVEPGELLAEALKRELAEEVAIEVRQGAAEFAFLQEGERCLAGGRRVHAWRSFFFHVRSYRGDPVATGEVSAIEWVDRSALPERLIAPYHDSFRDWLGGDARRLFGSRWEDSV